MLLKLTGQCFLGLFKGSRDSLNCLGNDLFRCLSSLPTMGTNVQAETTGLYSEFFFDSFEIFRTFTSIITDLPGL